MRVRSCFHVFTLIAGYLCCGLDAAKASKTNFSFCTGEERTLTCDAYKRVKPSNYRNLWWKVRGRGSVDWNTSIAYCDGKMTCNTSQKPSWDVLFRVISTKDGSLTIKLLQDTNLEFGCEVEKKDGSSPEWDVLYLYVDKCYTTRSNVTACVGQQKILDCDAVRRVKPENYRDLQWTIKRTDRWDNLSYCNRTFFCVVASRKLVSLYRIRNTSLVLLNVNNDGMKTYGCEVFKMDHSTPEFHLVYVVPIVCPETTSSASPSTRLSSVHSLSTLTTPLPTNASLSSTSTVNATISNHANRSSTSRILWREAVIYGLFAILGRWCFN